MAKHPPVNHRKLAERREEFSGEIALTELDRLEGLVHERCGNVRYRLAFYVDDRHFVRARGELSATLRLLCLRSLEPFDQAISREIDIALVRTEAQEARFGDASEVVLLDDDAVRVDDLIEDELILAIPLVPMNPQATTPPNPAEAVEEEPAVEAKASPFAKLAALKNSSKTGK